MSPTLHPLASLRLETGLRSRRGRNQRQRLPLRSLLIQSQRHLISRSGSTIGPSFSLRILIHSSTLILIIFAQDHGVHRSLRPLQMVPTSVESSLKIERYPLQACEPATQYLRSVNKIAPPPMSSLNQSVPNPITKNSTNQQPLSYQTQSLSQSFHISTSFP